MKPISIFIILAALAVTAPAHAQQRQRPRLNGTLAGQDYCRKRFAGLPHAQAMDYAIEENMALYEYEPVFQAPHGETTKGVQDMARFIRNNCPQMYPRKR